MPTYGTPSQAFAATKFCLTYIPHAAFIMAESYQKYKVTSMSVLLIIRPKCMLAASHAAPW